ncbi:E3 ubiquitin-protein ligase RMND5A [Condylostylus longicornis]|uniref:E3 ubiquitin-protein ligase RMND5A n=1 Tax=Condylostylus longicornis TaxID=2530218 RepID=UPI00244DF815|nr:E3 ubiquitin-protein ligase RMND5A [Condylostylus longicornis]
MDACSAVEKELDRVVTKFTGIRDHAIKVFDLAFSDVENIRQIFLDDPEAKLTENQVEIIKTVLNRTKSKLQGISSDHRELHGTVSKVGKVIDRNFVSDFSATTRTDFLQDKSNVELLNKIIAQHYYRQGMDDVAQELLSESELPQSISQEIFESERSYATIYKIWEAILARNLEPALDWVSQYSNELKSKNSSLEFKLHRLVFMQILSRGVEAQGEAISYARKNFSNLIDRFEKEIQNLMGTLIYLPVGIENSPYKHLTSQDMWTEASYIFLKDACNTHGINKDSPLSIVVNAGCTALPALLSIKQVMLSRKVLGVWKQRDELPIDIELDAEYRYHSIFACPILRQQTFEDNPPMKLACGHVISRNAWSQLSHGPMLKCPYCPLEQSPDEAKYIYF